MLNKSRKMLSCALSAALALTCAAPFTTVSAATYSDTSKAGCADAVSSLSELGVISGYPDGTFRPDNSISRAEISKIISSAMLLSYDPAAAAAADEATIHPDLTDREAMAALGAGFRDVSADNWAAGTIGTASVCGIVTGYPDNTFRPSGSITYNELSAMVVRACEYDMTQVSGAWPANFVAAAEKLDLYKGIKDFDPAAQGSSSATRGNAAIIINNGLKAIQTAATDGYNAARKTPAAEGEDGTEGGTAEADVKALSLEEAIEIMQTTGLLAETAQLNAQSDKNALKSAKESISSINSILNNSDFMSLDALYMAQQNGATESNRKLAQLTRDFIEANLDNNAQAEMNGIEQTTRQLYYGLLQARENVEVCRESAEIEKELLEIAQQKHSLGMLSDLGLSQQEYSLTSAESKLSQAEQAVLSTQNRFNMLMNLPLDTQLDLTTPLEKLEAELPTLEEAIDSMMNNSLKLKQIDFGIEAAEIQYKSLRYTTSTSSSTYKKAETAYQNAVTGLSQAKSSMKTDMQTSYFELADLENQIASFESTIALTEKSLGVQETQLALGMTTVSDVNQTKLKLQQAKQGLTNAIVTYNTALTDFNFSMGIGTERLSFSSEKSE